MSNDPVGGMLRAFGVSDETIERARQLDKDLHEPTEEDITAAVWAVDLEVADERMIPAEYERMNGIIVPRPAESTEGGYLLRPSRVKRGAATACVLPIEDARAARARYILWHSYYVRAYQRDKLSYVEKDAARRLYWHGGEPPIDPEKYLVAAEIRRAVQGVVRPRKIHP